MIEKTFTLCQIVHYKEDLRSRIGHNRPTISDYASIKKRDTNVSLWGSTGGVVYFDTFFITWTFFIIWVLNMFCLIFFSSNIIAPTYLFTCYVSCSFSSLISIIGLFFWSSFVILTSSILFACFLNNYWYIFCEDIFLIIFTSGELNFSWDLWTYFFDILVY